MRYRVRVLINLQSVDTMLYINAGYYKRALKNLSLQWSLIAIHVDFNTLKNLS